MLHPMKSETCLVPYDMGAIWIDIGGDKNVCATWDDHERKLTIVAYDVIPGPEPDDVDVIRDGDLVGVPGVVVVDTGDDD